MESFLRVYLVNGNSNQIRFNDLTDIELILQLLTNRLSSDGADRPLKSLYSIRALKYPINDLNDDLNEIIWLENDCTVTELIKKYNLNIETCKFELRIRYFPFNFQQILEQDRVTFYYLYDQIKNDYFQTKKEINQDVAINLCCLEIRRFFKDITQFALYKKSNYECLEKEIGLHKFLPSSIISSVKPKVLRKLIQNQFKKVLDLDEIQCMTKFLDIVEGLIHYKTEYYKCEFKIFIHYLPVKLVVGCDVGISYLTDNTIAPTQMTAFTQIEYFQTLFKDNEDLKSTELTADKLQNKKFLLQLKIFGADELLSIICPTLTVVLNIAQLIESYCKLQFKKPESLWINKYNNFRPVENRKNTDTARKQSSYNNEEKDYAEIVDNDEDYSVPNSKLNDIDRSQVKLLNLIGNGQFGDVYKGLYKNELGEETEVAIKTCKSEKENNLSEKFLEEAYVMTQFEHKHIIRLIGICTDSPILILMELAKLGELRKFLQTNRSTIDLSRLILYCYQLSTALSYLESKMYVHRDLAARNVLVCSFDCVKLSDFGLSRIIDTSYYKASNCKLPIKWLAIESINFRKFTHKSDIWSFAVLMWEILEYGIRKPFEDIKNSVVIQKIENGERLPLPEICPLSLYNLMLKCWSYEPNDRPDIRQIKVFLLDLLNSLENGKSNETIDEELNKSLLDIQLKSQEKQSKDDAAWLENEEKEMFGSCLLSGSQFSSSDNQSLKSETSLSSNSDSKLSYSSNSKNPFLDSLENSVEKSDTLQNLNKSNLSLELDRENDDVYLYTTNVTINVKQLIEHINKGESDMYLEKVKSIGLELRNLLATVDNLINTLPEAYHHEISLSHSIIPKDFKSLADSMKQAQTYSNTTIENEFKKKMIKAGHALVMNSKELLNTIDSVRLKLLNTKDNEKVLG